MNQNDEIIRLSKSLGFFYPSYGSRAGSGGLYTLGPKGTAAINNLIHIWREIFISHRGYHEIETPTMTAADTNFVAPEGGQEGQVAGDETKQSSGAVLLGPPINNPNALFRTDVGNDSTRSMWLRPEITAGIIAEAANLISNPRYELPVGFGEVGRIFRNQSNHSEFLLRLRERTIAELAFFYTDSDSTRHHQLSNDSFLLIYSKSAQREPDNGPSNISQEQALLDGVIESQRLPYQMGLIQRFLTYIGISRERIRFREHLNPPNALTEAWDAEIKIADKWIELAGVAQRKVPTSEIFNINNNNTTNEEDGATVRDSNIRISEISVGLTRLIEILLRLTFTSPSGNDREYFALPTSVAPSIMAICTVNNEYHELASDIAMKLRTSGCRVALEQSGSIGINNRMRLTFIWANRDHKDTPLFQIIFLSRVICMLKLYGRAAIHPRFVRHRLKCGFRPNVDSFNTPIVPDPKNNISPSRFANPTSSCRIFDLFSPFGSVKTLPRLNSSRSCSPSAIISASDSWNMSTIAACVNNDGPNQFRRHFPAASFITRLCSAVYEVTKFVRLYQCPLETGDVVPFLEQHVSVSTHLFGTALVQDNP